MSERFVTCKSEVFRGWSCHDSVVMIRADSSHLENKLFKFILPEFRPYLAGGRSRL